MRALGSMMVYIGVVATLFSIIFGIAGAFGYSVIYDGNKLPLFNVPITLSTMAIAITIGIAGWLILKRNPEEDINLSGADLSFIDKSFVTTRTLYMVFRTVLILFGLGLFAFFAFESRSNSYEEINGELITSIRYDMAFVYTGLVVSLAPGIPGMILVYRSLKLLNFKKTKAYLTILNKPEQISKLIVHTGNRPAASQFINDANRNFEVVAYSGARKLGTFIVNQQQLDAFVTYIEAARPDLEIVPVTM